MSSVDDIVYQMESRTIYIIIFYILSIMFLAIGITGLVTVVPLYYGASNETCSNTLEKNCSIDSSDIKDMYITYIVITSLSAFLLVVTYVVHSSTSNSINSARAIQSGDFKGM